MTGRFKLLALLSLQNLAFIVFYLPRRYGGSSSSFLPWIIVTPPLTFFYLGEILLLCWLALCALAAGFAPGHRPICRPRPSFFARQLLQVVEQAMNRPAVSAPALTAIRNQV
jgi:hypothetical protein